MLVCVLRRVGRFQAALSELELLEGMDEARPWGLELAKERARLLQARNSPESEESSAQELRINEHQPSESMLEQSADDSELAGEDPAASPQRRVA